MDKETIELLKNAGLTDGEAKVLISLIELGETSTGPLIKRSRISSSKVYEILNRLISKGLVSYVVKDRVHYYSVESLDPLIEILEKKTDEINKTKGRVKRLAEQLRKQKAVEVSTKVYEGFRGIKTIFDTILATLKRGEEYYAFTLGEDLNNRTVLSFLRGYHRRRVRAGIEVKILAREGEEDLFNKLVGEGMEVRFSKYDLPTNTFIFNDYIALISFKEKTAILVKNRRLANSYKIFFTNLWSKARARRK